MKRKLTTLAGIVLALALCGLLVGCGNTGTTTQDEGAGTATKAQGDSSGASASDDAATSGGVITSVSAGNKYGSGTHHAVVQVKGYDSFTIELDADAAPVTVSNFCRLAESGFYDGLTFHRIVEDFCLQGGDPLGNGTGGSDQNIVGEFSDNGVDNALADDFGRGTVAMARSTNANTASSQFFITLASGSSVAASLNGQYAAFGTVDKAGMRVVDQIVADYLSAATGTSGTIEDTAAQPTIKSITITD